MQLNCVLVKKEGGEYPTKFNQRTKKEKAYTDRNSGHVRHITKAIPKPRSWNF